MPVEYDISDLHYGEPDREALTALFEELEFRTLAQRVFRQTGQEETPEAPPDNGPEPGSENLFSSAGIEVPIKKLRDINELDHEYKDGR